MRKNALKADTGGPIPDMKTSSFRGGIHPADKKSLSNSEPIRQAQAGKTLVFPLSRHIGAPSAPCVKVGARVLVGEKIADAGGFVGECVHSSVSGTVKAIEPRTSDNGSKMLSIVVENDGLYEKAEGVGVQRDPAKMTPEEILGAIRDAGIIGMGGAGFPLAVKLSPKKPENIKYVIVNAAECEPYITCDHRMMLERGEQVIDGARAVARLFPGAVIYIGVEKNKPDAIAHLTELAKDDPNVIVRPLRTKYPQGGERMLVLALTGFRLNSKLLPADAGCVVMNVSTAVAVRNAVCFSTPVISRIVTLSGEGMEHPCNLEVPTGTMLPDLLEQAGGLKEGVAKLISGGPMMGMALSTTEIPVYKTSSAFVALMRDNVSSMVMTECIKCGRCSVVCPERLFPARIVAAVDMRDNAMFLRLGGLECIECGSCAYTCPAKRPLVQSIRYGKAEARKKK